MWHSTFKVGRCIFEDPPFVCSSCCGISYCEDPDTFYEPETLCKEPGPSFCSCVELSVKLSLHNELPFVRTQVCFEYFPCFFLSCCCLIFSLRLFHSLAIIHDTSLYKYIISFYFESYACVHTSGRSRQNFPRTDFVKTLTAGRK